MEEQIRLYPRSGIRPPNACESRRPFHWASNHTSFTFVDTHLSPFVLLFALYGPQYSVSLCANWQHSDFSGHFNKATYLREKKNKKNKSNSNIKPVKSFLWRVRRYLRRKTITENIGKKNFWTDKTELTSQSWFFFLLHNFSYFNLWKDSTTVSWIVSTSWPHQHK